MLHGLKKDLVEIIGFVSRIQRYRYDVRFMYLKIKNGAFDQLCVCACACVCVCVCVCSSCVFPGGLGLKKKQIINASNCYYVRYAEPSNKESRLEKSSDGDFVQLWILQ